MKAAADQEPEADDYLSLLPKLGSAIDSCLAGWETYLTEIETHPSYETVISSVSIDNATKIQALEHLVSTLPLRHAALIKSCADPDLELVELPEKCDALLEELFSMRKEMELDAWFGLVAKNKRFVKQAVDLDKGIREEEMFRKQELNRLKGLHMSLMMVRDDGGLAQKDVEALFDAMEALGVSLVGVGIAGEVEEFERIQGICGA